MVTGVNQNGALEAIIATTVFAGALGRYARAGPLSEAGHHPAACPLCAAGKRESAPRRCNTIAPPRTHVGGAFFAGLPFARSATSPRRLCITGGVYRATRVRRPTRTPARGSSPDPRATRPARRPLPGSHSSCGSSSRSLACRLSGIGDVKHLRRAPLCLLAAPIVPRGGLHVGVPRQRLDRADVGAGF
jgi:hypothetical protein